MRDSPRGVPCYGLVNYIGYGSLCLLSKEEMKL